MSSPGAEPQREPATPGAELPRPSKSVKHRLVHVLQKYVLNPPIKLFLYLGIAPPGYALLETLGRTTGKPRRTPVGRGLEGDTFWIVSEHGMRAGYVRNIVRNPNVRVKVRRGIRQVWIPGVAHLMPEDDPRQRQRTLSRGHPLRWLNGVWVRTLGSELLTVRIDLTH